MKKPTDEEIKKVTDAIFGKDDYTGLVIGVTFGIGLIFIGLYMMWIF
jgi:hypothetical protein